MMQLTTEADSLFMSLVANGSSLEDASFEAYPAKEHPIKYAMAKQKNIAFVRANYHAVMAEKGLSERDVIDKLAQAAELAIDSPKSSGALLKVVQECNRIYDIYPQTQQKADSLQVGSITINDRTQILQQVYQQATKEMPEKEIEKMLESAKIGELKVISKEELFDNGDQETKNPEV